MTIGKYRVTLNFKSRQKWTHAKLHTHKDVDTYHFVWGKLSILIENIQDDLHPVCALCDGNAEECGYGDEGWTVCEDCGAVEQGYRYISLSKLEA